MNKAFFIFLFSVSFLQNPSAQTNLIYNGDFELYDTCPLSISLPGDYQIEHCLGWYSPTEGTSDYFNSCHFNLNPFTEVDVPENFIGNQSAFSGVGYLGFYGYVDWINGKEYIQSKLLMPMTEGNIYFIEFFISMADSSQYALNEIGVYFSNLPLSRNDYAPFNVQPNIITPSNLFIDDTIGWTLVSGYYFSSGGEEYITIGSFQDSLSINVQVVSPPTSTGAGTSYYYVDNVSVLDVTEQFEIPNVFSPNGDWVNDVFILPDISGARVYVFNRWGELVGKIDESNNSWDGRTMSGLECPEGVYFYTVEIKTIKKKGFIHLIR